jgi:hypothetical protein
VTVPVTVLVGLLVRLIVCDKDEDVDAERDADTEIVGVRVGEGTAHTVHNVTQHAHACTRSKQQQITVKYDE